jgi:UDP-arabinose 4-epimerase
VNVVFSSSCATYGVPERLPLKEDAAQNPVNPYGYTKLAVERMLKDAEAAYGIRHVALRYFNAAGADPDGDLGELHQPETHLIPLVLFAAMGREPLIKIFGNDYPTPDGTSSATLPTPMWRPSPGLRRVIRATRSISAMALASRSQRSYERPRK